MQVNARAARFGSAAVTNGALGATEQFEDDAERRREKVEPGCATGGGEVGASGLMYG